MIKSIVQLKITYILPKKVSEISKQIYDYDNEEAIQDSSVRIALVNKDKIDKKYQMLSDIIKNYSKSDDINNDKINEKMLDEVIVKCCELDVKIEKSYQIVKENNENIKKNVKENKNPHKNDRSNEIFDKIDLKLTNMEDKIVNDLEAKNENLMNKNTKLKKRITNINKDERVLKMSNK